MRKSNTLVIGFGKGRGLQEASQCFSFHKNPVFKDFLTSKIPYFKDVQKNLICIKVRHADLEWMLEEEHINVAIGSSIWFKGQNENYNAYYLNDEYKTPCRLSLIAKTPFSYRDGICIATKFPELTKAFFKKKGYNVHIKYMEGCHENALMLHFADAIVDIIETGNTIKNLQLTEIETIQYVSHKLYVKKPETYNEVFKHYTKELIHV